VAVSLAIELTQTGISLAVNFPYCVFDVDDLLLNTIGAAIGQRSVLVLVDAVVPPESGSHRTPDPMRQMLDEQTANGALRRWLDWWPPEVVAGPTTSDQAERHLVRWSRSSALNTNRGNAVQPDVLHRPVPGGRAPHRTQRWVT
jgi:hypothetical protein